MQNISSQINPRRFIRLGLDARAFTGAPHGYAHFRWDTSLELSLPKPHWSYDKSQPFQSKAYGKPRPIKMNLVDEVLAFLVGKSVSK